MIKFTDNALVGAQFFTPGMIAEFDDVIESWLIDTGNAVSFSGSGTVTNALTADFATNAQTAQTAITAQSATTAQTATTANSATSATTAQTATTATNANHATTADSATTADHATTATTATTATSATTATTATNATHATTADSATSANSATTAATATTASGVLAGTQTVKPVMALTVELLSGFAEAVSCKLSVIDEPLASFQIAAGTLGPNSSLQIEPLWTYTNNANAKLLKIKIAGVLVYSVSRTTSQSEGPELVLANRNSLTSQIRIYDSVHFTAGATAPATYAIDFSQDVIVEIIGQRANTTDTLKLEYYRVLHFVGA